MAGVGQLCPFCRTRLNPGAIRCTGCPATYVEVGTCLSGLIELTSGGVALAIGLASVAAVFVAFDASETKELVGTLVAAGVLAALALLVGGFGGATATRFKTWKWVLPTPTIS